MILDALQDGSHVCGSYEIGSMMWSFVESSITWSNNGVDNFYGSNHSIYFQNSSSCSYSPLASNTLVASILASTDFACSSKPLN